VNIEETKRLLSFIQNNRDEWSLLQKYMDEKRNTLSSRVMVDERLRGKYKQLAEIINLEVTLASQLDREGVSQELEVEEDD
jgi:hypothetical protein